MEMYQVLVFILLYGEILGARITCPKDCDCFVDEISCQRKNLTAFPDHLSPKIRILNLSYNRLLDIPTKLSKITNLEELILTHNLVKRINKTHLNISSLTVLDLSYNNFTQWSQVHTDSFNHTTKIKKLDLSYNRFEHISTSKQYVQSKSLETLVMKRCIREPLPKLFLSGLKHLKRFIVSENFRLKEIDLVNATSLEYLEARNTGVELVNLSNFPNLKEAVLRGSRINYIRAEHFNNKNLMDLDLSDNGIKFIRNNSFLNLPELRFVDLSMNVFVDLDSNMFMNNLQLEELVISHTYLKKLVPFNSSSLVTLDFSINEIQQFNNESLKNMPSLKYLNLCRNLISSLPNQIVSNSLQYFNLSTCQISGLRESTFSNLQNLRILDLSNNKLTSFKRNYFPISIHQIKLDKNLWRCECYSKDFIDQYNYLMYPYDLTSKKSLICHDPENVSGLTWDEACGPVWDNMQNNMLQHGKMWMYIISMVLAMSVIFCATMCIRRMHHVKIMREEAERLRQRMEAQDRLDRLRRESQRQTEAQQNAPDPRELQRPPSYHEAIRMPRLDGSMHSLSASRPSLASIPGSPTTPGPSDLTASKTGGSRSRDLDVDESRDRNDKASSGRPKRARTPRSDRRRRRRRSRAMSGDWDTRSERSVRSVEGTADDLEVTRSMILDTDGQDNEESTTGNNNNNNDNGNGNENNGDVGNINR